jgi:hypothetical protein
MAVLDIGALMRRHRLAPTMRIYQLARRLRCSACGSPARATGVEGWRR